MIRYFLFALFFICGQIIYSKGKDEETRLVISSNKGIVKAFNISEIDSLYFTSDSFAVSQDPWIVHDTIYYKDTVYHIDSVYYSQIDLEPLCPSERMQILTKDTLRVLAIGNSFTDDVTAYLNDIINASGSNVRKMCFYKLCRPTASFYNWVNVYNGVDNTRYTYTKVFGGVDNSAKGGGNPFSNELMKNVLNKPWDLIIIHPLSSHSDNFDMWGKWSGAGGLDSLLSILKTCQPLASIGFMLTHASYNNSIANGQTTEQRWVKIMESAKKMRNRYGVSFIIPCGTAVENLRLTQLRTANFLSHDGHHLEQGLTRYAAACAYYQALVAPRSGISILGNSYRRKMSNTNCLDITDETAPIAQMAAFLATAFWWKNLNPEDYLDK